MATKQPRDPQAIDGQIQLGTPLYRLQGAFDDEETGVLVGDLRDVCNACDQSDGTVAKLVKKIGEKPRGERIVVGTDDVEHLTALLVEPPRFAVTESAPVVVKAPEVKHEAKAPRDMVKPAR